MDIVNILGQDYKIKFCNEEEFPKLNLLDANGLAELYSKEIIINSGIQNGGNDKVLDNISSYENKVIRHEIIHCFFHEAGLTEYCYDEQLVEWLAIQLPKMAKSMNDIGVLYGGVK